MDKTQEKKNRQERRAHIAGWFLFIVCALFFIAAALKNGDSLTFIGSIVFLLACVVFLIPLFGKSKAPHLKSHGKNR